MHPLKFSKHEEKTPIFFKFSPEVLIHGKRALKLDVIENSAIVNNIEVPLIGPSPETR
jgi:hypothetical protein